MAYHNTNGFEDGDTSSGWVHVFAVDDSKVSKTPFKKAKARSENQPINKGLGEVVKIQSTSGNYVLASLMEDNELSALYHPEGAGGMPSEDLTHGWSKFIFNGALVGFCGSPTNVICMIMVGEDDDETSGRALFHGEGGSSNEKEDDAKAKGHEDVASNTSEEAGFDEEKEDDPSNQEQEDDSNDQEQEDESNDQEQEDDSNDQEQEDDSNDQEQEDDPNDQEEEVPAGEGPRRVSLDGPRRVSLE